MTHGRRAGRVESCTGQVVTPSAAAEDTPAMAKPLNASPSTRSAAEAKYRTLRDLDYQAAMHNLAAAGIHAELRSIDAAALAHAAQ